MKPVEEIYAFLTADDQGNEKVLGVSFDDRFIPFVTADVATLAKMRSIVSLMVANEGIPASLAKYTHKTVLEVFREQDK